MSSFIYAMVSPRMDFSKKMEMLQKMFCDLPVNYSLEERPPS